MISYEYHLGFKNETYTLTIEFNDAWDFYMEIEADTFSRLKEELVNFGKILFEGGIMATIKSNKGEIVRQRYYLTEAKYISYDTWEEATELLESVKLATETISLELEHGIPEKPRV